MSAMASQITGVLIVYLTVCSGVDQLIHLWPMNSPSVINAENVRIWLRHHADVYFMFLKYISTLGVEVKRNRQCKYVVYVKLAQ